MRDLFRENVFKRDNYQCVVCKRPADAAHHILERRLFPDGGYNINNGASLCPEHHIEAEKTTLTCDQIRELCGIATKHLPPHFYRDLNYDKWGNILLDSGQRVRGELFDDGSVQKILQDSIHLFTKHIKYPRTYHLPWSKGLTKDDRMMPSLDNFIGKRVIVTVKEDGENSTLYNDYLHARSLDYSPHPSRNLIKALHAQIQGDIPEGWRICGENLYAKHSIHYNNLPAYFLMFSLWDNFTCFSWDTTVEWAKLFGLQMVPILYDGIWDEDIIKNLYKPIFDNNECEGYVVRLADSFHYKEFNRCVGKFVRESHVQTHGHWTNRQVTPNLLKEI